jgi:hypothetical protein
MISAPAAPYGDLYVGIGRGVAGTRDADLDASGRELLGERNVMAFKAAIIVSFWWHP